MATIVESLKSLYSKLGGRKSVNKIETIAGMVDKITDQVDTFADGGGFTLNDEDELIILPKPSDPSN